MKILYLTDQVYLHGGVEKVLSQKANYLADISGAEVIIVTYNQSGRRPVYLFSEKIEWRDLNINYKIEKSYLKGENLNKVQQHFSALRKTLAEVKPDIIISCSFGPDFYFLPFVFKNIPKIKEFHSSRYFYSAEKYSLKKGLFRYLDKITEKKYDQIVVLNKSEVPFYNNKNITVIPNPVEIESEKVDYNSKKILAAGRISPVKNFTALIEVFSRLKTEFPDWEVHFWGEDYIETQQILETQISEKKLQNHIFFKGVSQNLKKEMGNYSIYAMTSESECFPMVLLESLSVGLPVISYDCPTGPKHILTDHEDSFLIPYKNLDIFTKKLKMLMQNNKLRSELGYRGIENVKRFKTEKIMSQWQKLFSKLISN